MFFQMWIPPTLAIQARTNPLIYRENYHRGVVENLPVVPANVVPNISNT